jgi:Subtilase family
MTTKMAKKEVISKQFIFDVKIVDKNGDKIVGKKESDLSEAERVFRKSDDVKYSNIKVCGCNQNLILFEFDKKIDFLQYYDDSKQIYIQLEDGLFYQIVGSMPNEINGSPDVEDPPPSGPIRNASDRWLNVEPKDDYVPLRKAWLDAAFENSNRNPKAPVVAILDSGIDLRYFLTNPDDLNDKSITFPLHYIENLPCNLSFNSEKDDKPYIWQGKRNCIYGWNFINNDPHSTFPHNPFDDDIRHKHGTRIAKIIADVTNNKVRIMPLKTANFEGKSTFFDIFCAFEFILNYNANCGDDDNKVKFINASWGYYGQEYDMFTHYIKSASKLNLENENGSGMKFINAAGNAGDDLGSFIDRANDARVEIGGNSIRPNITPRYPTMYSKDCFNVYTATTIDRAGNAIENFSPVYVEVGVIGMRPRQIENKDGSVEIIKGTFPDPLQPSEFEYIKGSSYATAYLTGMLARSENNDYDRRPLNSNSQEDFNSATIRIDVIIPANPNLAILGNNPEPEYREVMRKLSPIVV